MVLSIHEALPIIPSIKNQKSNQNKRKRKTDPHPHPKYHLYQQHKHQNTTALVWNTEVVRLPKLLGR